MEKSSFKNAFIYETLEDPYEFHYPPMFQEGYQVLEEIRKDEMLCDITVKVDNASFVCHKIVLVAASPYFKAMFSQNMIENENKEVVIEGIDVIAFRALMNFAYTGRITINMDNVFAVIFGADYLQINSVKIACAAFLEKRINLENVLEVRLTAKTLHFSRLAELADQYICQYFIHISHSDTFLNVAEDDLIEIISNELNVDKEEQVLESVLAWVAADLENRKNSLPRLMSFIRLPLLNFYHFIDHVYEDTFINSFSECKVMLDEARNYGKMPERLPRIQMSFKVKPRICKDFIWPIFYADGATNKSHHRSEAVVTLVKEKFCEIADSAVLSPEYFVRDLPWKIGITLSSNESSNKNLTFYLVCNDGVDGSWGSHANFRLSIISQKDGVQNYVREYQHFFDSPNKMKSDTNFISDTELLNPENCWIQNDTVIFQAHIVADPPYGIWDSKKYTGYVGLLDTYDRITLCGKAVLQTLFCINLFRKAVYKVPISSDNCYEDIPLAIQKVFYCLQCSYKPVDVGKAAEPFHDFGGLSMNRTPQEFLKVILDELLNKIRGSTNDPTISNLFEGTMETVVTCKNVNYGSKKSELFHFLELKVQGNKNIYESLLDLVGIKTLDENNQYYTGEFGLQDAEKSVVFESFPPVLVCFLSRSEPKSTGNVCKDRFEFYEKIRLDSYLREPQKEHIDYVLFAVLVHENETKYTRYYAFIDTQATGEWYMFEDTVVSKSYKQRAIDYNYGGQEKKFPMSKEGFMNAYMLVYIRHSDLETILQKVSEEDIPSGLKKSVASNSDGTSN